MSIWQSIDRPAFEANLSTLCTKNKHQPTVPLPNVPRIPQSRENQSQLTDKQELNLAYGFAFLASVKSGGKGVSSAAVQHMSDPPRLRILIATNKGVDITTEHMLTGIAAILARRAAEKINKGDAFLACLKVVVENHRARIHGRLLKDGQNIALRIDSFRQMVQARPDGQVLATSLAELSAIVSTVQAATTGSIAELNSIKSLLGMANEIMTTHRVLLLSLHESMSPWLLRSLSALSYYTRLIQFLLREAKINSLWFRDLELMVLPYHPVEKWKGRKKVVHAEIQIAFHLDSTSSTVPRYIRTTKRPCYLCYCFLRAYRMYGAAQSHGEVYEQWAVPISGLKQASISPGLRAALRQTADEVARAVKRQAKRKDSGLYLNPQHTVSKILSVVTATSIEVSLPPVMNGGESIQSSIVALQTSPSSEVIAVIDLSDSANRSIEASLPQKTAELSADHTALESWLSRQMTKIAEGTSKWTGDLPGYLAIRGFEVFLDIEGGSMVQSNSAFIRLREVQDGFPADLQAANYQSIGTDGMTLETTTALAAQWIGWTIEKRNLLFEIRLH